MNRLLLLIFGILCFNTSIAQSDELHPWYETNNLGVEFNKDQSQVLIVGYDVVTLWNTADATLIKSMKMPLFNGTTPIKKDDFTFIDAAPDLSEFIYKTAGTYQRFMMDIEGVDFFPDFQRHNVKNIYGYDTEGWIIFFSEGFYQGFYRVQQKGNTSFLQFITLEYIDKATVSNDHKYIYFTRDRTFRYVNIFTKVVVDTELPAALWRDRHLPDGMLTLYRWDGSEKKGKEVQWRYFIEPGKEIGKKLKGKTAQSYFYTESDCLQNKSYVYGVTSDTQWSMYFYKRDGDRGKYAYQFVLKKEDLKNDCKVLKVIEFSESEADNTARKQQKRDDYFVQRKEDKEKEMALKPSWFREYTSKFVQLPNTYTLDYNSIAGVDVTNMTFVQNEKYKIGNPSEFAIGRIAVCSNGNMILLRMTRSVKSGMDRTSFRVYTYDSLGNEINQQKIAETQKYNGQFPILSTFTIRNNNGDWAADIKVTYQNGKVYRIL